MPDLRLKVDGMLYGGWKAVRIQRSIEAVCGRFELSVTDRWSGQNTPRPIRPGAECQVLIDNKPVITGYVDDVNISYDAGSRSITISGRDKVGDAVDCSAKLGQLNNLNLLEIAERLCAPYKITVLVEPGVDVGERFPTVAVNPGDSIFETLSSKARARGVLLTSGGDGRMVITRASSERIGALLLLGENIIDCSASFSHRDRFSEYEILGGRSSSDDDDDSPVNTWANISARSYDLAVKRFRQMILPISESLDLKTAQVRADVERNIRYGQSQKIAYTVKDWHYEPGSLWPINRLVAVKDESVGVDQDLLIATVVFLLDDAGFRTQMELVPREAFDLAPLPTKSGDPWSSL